tara:strand:+ start:1720 stop:2361 length:642 start_codon:yes stop_codon:yes gene_type:complete
MLNKLPAEMWLSIFKYMNVQELFQKRIVCKYFKFLVDNNLKYFYNNFSRLYPEAYIKIDSQITHLNFQKGFTHLYIENFKNYDCTPYYIKKIKNDNITLSQAKLILNLYRNHNIQYHHGVNCINFNSQEIEQMLKLKAIGIPDFFCILFTCQIIYTERQFNTIKKLKELGISEFYSSQITLTFTDERLEYFYSLVNSNMWFVHAFHLAQQKIF